MKRVEVDKQPRFAKSGARTLRAAMLACGFGSLAAIAQAPEGFRDQADTGLVVTLDANGNADPGWGIAFPAGQRINLVAAVAGAAGTVRYDWDFDEDGVIDRTGTQSEVVAIYNSAFVRDDDDLHEPWYDIYWDGEVSVRATDSAGNVGVASVPFNIDVMRLGADTVGPFNEVCGDGDALKEPGEHWEVTMFPYNGGSVAANAGYTLLAPGDRWLAAVAGAPGVGTYTLDRPAIPANDLAGTSPVPGGPIAIAGPDTEVTIRIARSAPCGSRVEIRSDVGVDAVSSGRFGPDVADYFYLAPAGQCQVYTACDESVADIEPRQGLYFNPQRPGNGISVLLRQTPQGTVFFGAWFTGDAGHRPTWYIVQGYLSGNQVVAPIYRFTRRPGAAFAVDRTQVGDANVVLVDAERLAFAYTLKNADGTNRPRLAELLTHIAPGAPASTDASGAYYAASETGWGQVLSEYRGADGADTAFLIHYLYDAQGEPRWVLAVEPTSALASTHPYITFPVHCPSCAWLPDWQTLRAEVGSGSFTLDGPGRARVTTQFTLPAGISGSWQRTALGVELLTDPP